jgi:murein DD-endopeptidase MepM/ murein hydrolase activator NlpD
MGDIVFKQYLDDVALGRQAVRPPKVNAGPEAIAQSLTLYSYTPKDDDDFFRIAARCNIPYSALATINRLPHAPSFSTSGPLVLPSVPGIFIPETPESDLERLLAAGRAEDAGVLISVSMGGKKQQFRFLPGDDFTPTERTFFLNPGIFRFPLQKWTLTSAFGRRVSPISGKLSNHTGLDLAAPLGAEIHAAADGVVTETGENPVYGKFIIIQHADGWASLYGHLSSIGVSLHGNVKTGNIIGKVGTTGLSTGPHLHFELRRNGQAQDPGRLLGGAVKR